ncbi:zeta toxin family protein [Halomonas sp. CUBES01]|uniref:Zeta toxin domain-containing protein n=1 Tax=Vreelandella gomseomensis TaxID=370766 RepID=A0ABU1GE92_9GAMM|nr:MULTISPECIES: zeta toxin family protein [Halomonas]MDR5875408.1 hypothetical protein [Halomonas gomseomensis]MEC4766245.1 zeta toxin family protein [Halomonas sp. CUBES01]
MPTCWIIAGPNGAGKTTFAFEYLPQVANGSRFVNADLIAAGLSPFAPEKELMAASRLFLKEIDWCVKANEDFAFETTLSGITYLHRINQLRRSGWRVVLFYLALPSVEMSHMRVAERVSHGGHNIPKRDIERRFPRSLANLFMRYSIAVDECLCFMNSGMEPELVFEQHGCTRHIIQHEHFQHLLEVAAS